jgi:hypothetical protein
MSTLEQRGYQMFPVLDGARVETATGPERHFAPGEMLYDHGQQGAPAWLVLQKVGMPVHPGTLLWIASRKNTTIIGLPSCGLGPQVTAFDLVVPKLLAEGAIRDEDLAALGHGGILNFAQSRILMQEPVDEPVR